MNAQNEFELFLGTVNKNKREIFVKNSLTGNIDLNAIIKLGFTKVKTIRFSPGEISGLLNIPEGLKTLVCVENILENIELPSTLEEVDLTSNQIREINISRLTNLHILRLSHNFLQVLNGFSEQLTELYCNHNDIRLLQLKQCTKLHTLHCKDNVHLVLENIPETLVNMVLPSTISLRHREIQPIGNEYIHFIKKYFQIKARYESQLRENRMNKKKTLYPKCIGCGKTEGMIFSCKDDKYQAYCGSSNPCDWKIMIHRGHHQSQEVLLNLFTADLEEHQENLIRQKLDTIFEYISERSSISLFEKQVKMLKEDSETKKELVQKYHDHFFNESRKQTIEEKTKIFHSKLLEVKEALRNNDIHRAVEIQYKEIFPLSQFIQREQYEIIEMVSKQNENRLLSTITESESEANTKFHFLVQEPVSHYQQEDNLGEKPKVEIFGKKP